MTGERVSTEDMEIEALGLDGFNAIDDDGEGLPEEALAELAALDAEGGGEDFKGEARQAEFDELRSELSQVVERYRSAVLAGAPDYNQRWIDLGTYTEAEIAQFYEDGRDAVARLEDGAFPFDCAYVDWTSAPHWGIPEPHADWPFLEPYETPLTTGRRLPWTDTPRK